MRSLARILLAAVCILLLVGGGWLAVMITQAARLQRQVVELEEQLRRQEAHHQAVLERLGRARRVGSLQVISQHRAADPAATAMSPSAAAELPDDDIRTTVLFVELDEGGRELGRTQATLPGRVIFLDAWTVRFPQETVAAADPLRGRSVALLRRIYSDRMQPVQGVAIDTPGAVPHGYAAGDAARFEQAIWRRFWALAGDPAAAAAEGVRVAQGEAVYKPVTVGQRFRVELESSGGLTLIPE
jgi:hypothetical protein